MNSSFDSLYSICTTQSETAPLIQNGQLGRSHLANSGTNSPQSTSPRQKVRRSQPMHILAVRRLQEEEQFRTSSLPTIPNPFPELCSPASSPVLTPGSVPQSQPPHSHVSILHLKYKLPVASIPPGLASSSPPESSAPSSAAVPSATMPRGSGTVIKVFSEDGTSKAIEIPSDITARDVCQLLIYKCHCVDDNSWTLVEHHHHLGLERCLEDHEMVVQIQTTWIMGNESRFLFRKNYAKYEFFKSPTTFFPEQMVTWCQESNGSNPRSQLLQDFLNSNSCPEIQGFLHIKELGKKSWKKLYVFLRRSGFYCSLKGTSKEPRHLQLLADIEDCNVFSLVAGKKTCGAPTDYGFCIKPIKMRNETKELRLLCAEDEQSRTCWMTAFRLLKYGMLLYQNYLIPQQRKALQSHFTTPVRSASENSLVAMDFSGHTGRVIENPLEAQSAAMEEGNTWRKRSQRMNALGSSSPLHPSPLSHTIHRTQPWFHGRISRKVAHSTIEKQGPVDGLFLLRDSQSNPKTFVLTLYCQQKIRHFQILPSEDNGQLVFSLDDGNTKFCDLIQLVEFYLLNRGILPCKLKHHCSQVSL
uniref:Growth factor receptor-bound protein 10b n=1 Tax=Callorhinchus milii TaxID=7868 RepID=A0A4W3K038_CALMI